MLALLGLALPVLTGPLGWAFSFLNALWSSQLGRVILLGGLGFLSGWVLGWDHERQIEAEAVAQQRAAFEYQISQANVEGDRRVAEALTAAKAVLPLQPNVTHSELIRLCRRATDCRVASAKK